MATAVKPVLPLTERILGWFGPPRLLWALLWGLMPLALLVVDWLVARALAVPGLSLATFARGELTPALLWAYVEVAMLLIIPMYVRQITQLQSLAARLRADDGEPQPFRGINAVWAPLALSVLTAVAYMPSFWRYGPTVVALLFPLHAIASIPAMTGVWAMIVIFLGLSRLGSMPLRLEPFTIDRSLGLRPFGQLALWAFVPLPLLSLPLIFVRYGVADLILNLAVTVLGTVLFFSSLLGLHGQLRRAKARYAAWARGLYGEVLAPVIGAMNPGIPAPGVGGGAAALRSQSAELLAAAELERRVASIYEWPFDEGTLRTLAAIATSVAAAILARLLLSRVGL